MSRVSAEGVQQVEKGKDWMAEHHPRSGITHDGLDLRPHRRLVAVGRAAGAGCLFRPVRAAIQAAESVGQKRLAFGAERAPRGMMGPTIHAHHRLDRPFLAGQACRRFAVRISHDGERRHGCDVGSFARRRRAPVRWCGVRRKWVLRVSSCRLLGKHQAASSTEILAGGCRGALIWINRRKSALVQLLAQRLMLECQQIVGNPWT